MVRDRGFRLRQTRVPAKQVGWRNADRHVSKFDVDGFAVNFNNVKDQPIAEVKARKLA
jgi:hypothetical protein